MIASAKKKIRATLEVINNIIFVSIPIRLLKRNILTEIGKPSGNLTKRALVYYKTDPFFSKKLRDAYVHTNNSEICEIVKVLNSNGYTVDLVDRNARKVEVYPLLEKNYDLLISNAAGNSAPLHEYLIENIRARKKIFYAAGPEPSESNRLVSARHDDLDKRTGKKFIRRRLVKGDSFAKRFNGIDAIFYMGNRFNRETFNKYNLPMYRITPSTSPGIWLDARDIKKKCVTNFLYFGGNGLICKGLDLVLEAFDGLTDVRLDVCSPAEELDFWEHYRPLLERNKNINYHGFVPVSSSLFKNLTARAAFNIFPGSAEACATSVVTCMRRGVIPVITYETGVDIDGFGIEIKEKSVAGIRNLIINLCGTEKAILERMVVDTYIASMGYTQEGYRNSFNSALLRVTIT